MKISILRKVSVLILAAILVVGMFGSLKAEAVSKPGKPSISLASAKSGTSVKITISETKNAEGYLIYMKSDDDSKYKKIKTLKKDGTASRSYTVTNLSEGTYIFKVKAYLKNNGKTVKGSYGKEKAITLIAEKTDSGLKSNSEYSKYKAGDIFTFGSYEQDNISDNGKESIEWIVLSNDGKELLILSKYALDSRKYDNDFAPTTWAECDLRKWLNDDFLNAAFSKKEKELIKTKTLKNKDNTYFQYGAIDGGDDTKDQVFLLSIDDVINPAYGFDSDYDKQETHRRCLPTDYAIAQGTRKFSSVSTDYGSGSCNWWLRSPGDSRYAAALVSFDGNVSLIGTNADYDSIAVRPALYIDLNK